MVFFKVKRNQTIGFLFIQKEKVGKCLENTSYIK